MSGLRLTRRIVATVALSIMCTTLNAGCLTHMPAKIKPIYDRVQLGQPVPPLEELEAPDVRTQRAGTRTNLQLWDGTDSKSREEQAVIVEDHGRIVAKRYVGEFSAWTWPLAWARGRVYSEWWISVDRNWDSLPADEALAYATAVSEGLETSAEYEDFCYRTAWDYPELPKLFEQLQRKGNITDRKLNYVHRGVTPLLGRTTWRARRVDENTLRLSTESSGSYSIWVACLYILSGDGPLP